ncbi:PIN domain-containing protein [Thermococcus sp.]
MELIELASVELIDEEDNFEVIARTSEKYGLLPNDATIVATCIKHGITEIATFDKDFENVSFLKIVRG